MKVEIKIIYFSTSQQKVLIFYYVLHFLMFYCFVEICFVIGLISL